jgi:hypothetical protein
MVALRGTVGGWLPGQVSATIKDTKYSLTRFKVDYWLIIDNDLLKSQTNNQG